VCTSGRRHEDALRTRGSDKITVDIAGLDQVREESWSVDLRCLVIEHHHGKQHVLRLVARGIFSLIPEGVFATQRVVNVGKRLLYRHGNVPRIGSHQQTHSLDHVNLAFMMVKGLGSRLGASTLGTRTVLSTVGVLGDFAVLRVALLEPARVRLL
jgi:hypothetical protein